MAKSKQTIRQSSAVRSNSSEQIINAKCPYDSLAAYPGRYVSRPRILWVGCGDFFRRVAKEGTFDRLHQLGAEIVVVDVKPKDLMQPTLPCFMTYYDVTDDEQRLALISDRRNSEHPQFTHCYISNWPQAHLLSAVKYSDLCHGGDIIITKPLDLNVPMVEDIAADVFPDIRAKIFMDDHYRNKGSVRELHRILPTLQSQEYGRLTSFRMWLVERNTIEEENRLRALECGVIWDLASHLISLIQLFFLDKPHQGLLAYGMDDPNRICDVSLVPTKVLRMQYKDCGLRSGAETLAVIEVKVKFRHRTYVDNEWKPAVITGLLVVGKGAARGERVQQGVKEIDLRFETGTVNLCLGTERIAPPFHDYKPLKENGFGQSIVELLTHSQRNGNGQRSADQTPAGRFNCAMPFADSYENVRLVNEILRHPSSRQPRWSYRQYEPIMTILARLVAEGALKKKWLNQFGNLI